MKSDPLAALMKHRSWKLERISPTTYPQDITIKLKYITPDQAEAIAGMMKRKSCFRCRLGTGRYFFAETPDEAVRLAIAGLPKRKAKA